MQKYMIQKEDWVICHIFQTKRSTTKDYAIIQTCKDYRVRNPEASQPKFIIELMVDPSLSSSGSSGITDEVFLRENYEESSDDDECVSSLDCLKREI